MQDSWWVKSACQTLGGSWCARLGRLLYAGPPRAESLINRRGVSKTVKGETYEI